ncbi:MAG: DUF3566 domain-containing protein [Pseudonocardia sp.]
MTRPDESVPEADTAREAAPAGATAASDEMTEAQRSPAGSAVPDGQRSPDESEVASAPAGSADPAAAAPTGDSTDGERAVAASPEDGTVAESASAARPDGAWTGNGRSEESSPRLPPPWQRTATADPGATARGAERDADTAARAVRTAAGARDATRPVDEPGRPIPDLGNARTVTVHSRSLDTDHRPDTDNRGVLGLGAGRGGFASGGSGSGGSGSGGSGSGGGTAGPGGSGAGGSGAGGAAAQVTPPGGFPMGWPRNRRPRQANLQLKRLDPWSVLKVALVLAVVLYLVWLVAVGVLYGALDGLGVWERLNGQYADLVAEQAGDQLISAGRVFGVAAVIGAINSLLFAVALSVGAFIYNVSADLVGGLEVTLSERD